MEEFCKYAGRVVAPAFVLCLCECEEKLGGSLKGDGTKRQVLKRPDDRSPGVALNLLEVCSAKRAQQTLEASQSCERRRGRQDLQMLCLTHQLVHTRKPPARRQQALSHFTSVR